MPMATELSRRLLLRGAAALSAFLALPASAAARPTRMLAAWDEPDAASGTPRHRVGLIELDAVQGRAAVRAAVDVPTRAHGLVWDPGSASALAVARRPGDWLLRWWPQRRGRDAQQWIWGPPQRRFNGHALHVGDRVLTTETDFDAGDSPGLVVVRDAANLQEVEVWPTHGRDPHALLADERGLWVANGGIGTDLATGRSKDVRAMDSSLVQLDLAASGALLGAWRLPDERLSLRHLARAADGSVGVALQAEHDDAGRRAAAPLLARWQRGTLQAVPYDGPPAGGYGGDIAVLGDKYFVSATRAGQLLCWSAREGWGETLPFADAGALAVQSDGLWCSGAAGWLACGPTGRSAVAAPRALQADNHAATLA
jgi:hypothetical protein